MDETDTLFTTERKTTVFSLLFVKRDTKIFLVAFSLYFFPPHFK